MYILFIKMNVYNLITTFLPAKQEAAVSLSLIGPLSDVLSLIKCILYSWA